MNKKTLLTTIQFALLAVMISSSLLVAISPAAMAVQENPLVPLPKNPGVTSINSLYNTYIQPALGWFFTAILVLAVIFLLVGAFKYVTSGGGEDTAAARGTIVYALVGIAVAALALVLVRVVANFFGATGVDTL